MPNIAVVLKDEIRRLARREIKAAIAGLRKDNARLKRTAAEHKRRLAELDKATKHLLAPPRAEAATAAPGESEKARITGMLVRKLRQRLGLSQADLAKLLGVSGQSVYQWERKEGRLALRGNTKAAIVAVRQLGKREVRSSLETLAQSSGAPAGARKKSARKKASKKASPAKARNKKGKKRGRK